MGSYIPYNLSKEYKFRKGDNVLTAKLTSKGQITIPKKVRDKLGISAGENVQFMEKKDAFLIKKTVEKSPFDKWLGRLKSKKGDTDKVIEEIRGR